MPRVQLIHWNKDESQPRAARLEAAGYEVQYGVPDGPAAIQEIQRDPPAAIVIDLCRLPSHGREVALFLRRTKSTRHVPLVFVEGEIEKVARIKTLLPDAVYTSWSRIRSALKRALANPPAEPIVPASGMAGYAGTPLPKKLGIKPKSVVALVGAPKDFRATLGEVPGDVVFRKQARGRCDLIVWFVKSRRELQGRIAQMAERIGAGGLWIAWPKKASGVASDLTQTHVRKTGLAAGLVDYKICAIDDTWSGLKFVVRKPKKR